MGNGTDPESPDGKHLDASYFTDGDALTKSLVDKRSTDQKQRSSFSDAQSALTDFAAKTDSGAWSSSLSRGDVAQRLTQIVTVPDPGLSDPAPSSGPRSLQQGGLNLCGPAALLQMGYGRDPVAVTQFATQLFDNGSATLGSLNIAPGADLLGGDYAAMLQKARDADHAGFTAAEWMLFGAVRNSTDVFWQGSWQGDPDQLLAGMTRPEELAAWMRASGIWSSVEDHGKWASNPGIVEASNLTMSDGTDIALLIHANLIAKSTLWNPNTGAPDDSGEKRYNPARLSDAFLLSSFPNHWVVLLSEVTPDVKGENVYLAIWTWGMRLFLCVPKQVFLDNYYGAVIGQTADN
jgi:hypothetical protein